MAAQVITDKHDLATVTDRSLVRLKEYLCPCGQLQKAPFYGHAATELAFAAVVSRPFHVTGVHTNL